MHGSGSVKSCLVLSLAITLCVWDTKWQAKGQLISECLFDFLNFPKNQQNICQISAPESKKWSNIK